MRTEKDYIIDEMEDESLGGSGLTDEEVGRLHRMTGAELFLEAGGDAAEAVPPFAHVGDGLHRRLDAEDKS